MQPADMRFAGWVRLTDIYARLCERALRGRRHPELLRRIAHALKLLESADAHQAGHGVSRLSSAPP